MVVVTEQEIGLREAQMVPMATTAQDYRSAVRSSIKVARAGRHTRHI